MTFEDLKIRHNKLIDIAWKHRTALHAYFQYHASSDLEKVKKYGKQLDDFLLEEKQRKESKQIEIF